MKSEDLLLLLGILLLLIGIFGCVSAGLADGFTLEAFDCGPHGGWWIGTILVPLGVASILAGWLLFRSKVGLGR